MSDILHLLKSILPSPTDASHLYYPLIGLLCIAGFYLNSLFALRNTTTIPHGKHYLLIIAHPDDECMFFSPTILNLIDNGNRVSVLCLSSGNADGLGKTREKELLKSCGVLGCRPTDTHILDHEALQDDINHAWDARTIVKELSRFVKSCGTAEERFDAFITFDDEGVSRHPNHTSILPATKQFLSALPNPPQPANANSNAKANASSARPVLWKLLSTSLVRKYIGPFDALLSLLLLTFRVARAPGRKSKKKEKFMCFMSGPGQLIRGQRAMVVGHGSQMKWFRWFWVMIGRYMYINELEREM